MEVKCAYTVKWILGWTQMHGYNAKHAGEIVGVVEYEADAEDPCHWVLSNPVWLKRFIPIAGHPAMWYLPREVAANINRQLSEIENKKGV